MKLGLTIAVFAFSVAASGIGMTNAANAQGPQMRVHGSYCLHPYEAVGAKECDYPTLALCQKDAQPMAAFCTPKHRKGRLYVYGLPPV